METKRMSDDLTHELLSWWGTSRFMTEKVSCSSLSSFF